MAPTLRCAPARIALAALLAACASPPEPGANDPSVDAGEASVEPPREGGGGLEIIDPGHDLGAACDPARSVQADGAALLERDPTALTGLSLERVLAQLLATAGASLTPEELLRRAFDTLNTTGTGVFADNAHCDDPANEAFRNASAVHCPRSEGALATSTTLLTSDAPDSFVPVAVVNRFDLAPRDFRTCGEFRIVFAKQSGRTDPENRLLMIFEGVLSNPNPGIAGCRSVAEFWADLEATPSAADRGARLEQLLFAGLPGFDPVIHAKHFGIDQFGCEYGLCGRLRLGLGMQPPWDFREFRLLRNGTGESGPGAHFAPVALDDTPVPGMFDTSNTQPAALSFRSNFAWWSREVARATKLTDMPRILADSFNAGEGALTGPTRPNFLDRVRESSDAAAFVAEINASLDTLELDCPPTDPITHESVLERATALTCAGCHAPAELLSSTRGVGCGLVWPNSLGEAHIDEHGNLSEALGDVLLPHRADVLSTYLRACDREAILAMFQPIDSFPCFVAGTPITMADGSLKPIEDVVAGDRVLTFDPASSTLTSGLVKRVFVHPNSDELVVVNDTLVATANHPFYSEGEWVRADALAPGSPLLTAFDADPTSAIRLEAGSGEVRQLSMREGTATTYNFEVAVHHAYFAGGILVHNKPPVP
jgi:hypothetical protein